MKIEALFPEACNLYGDAFNVTYLERSAPGAEVVRTAFHETPRFVTEDVDFIYMGTMPEREQPFVIEKLRPHTERLRELIDRGTVFLLTGNAFEVCGTSIREEGGGEIAGLGLYEGYAQRRMFNRFNSLFLGTYADDEGEQEVIGFKSQFTHTYADNAESYCFRSLRGCGIHPGSELEGIRMHNFFGTYLLGPLLIMNPLLTRSLLRLAGAEDPHPAFQEEAMEAYRARLLDFHDPKRKIVIK